MNKYINSNITMEEWIRLNNVTEPMIIDAADTIIEQEESLKEAHERIETLENIIQGFDIESIEYELDCLWSEADDSNKHIKTIQTLLDNFKQRAKQI